MGCNSCKQKIIQVVEPSIVENTRFKLRHQITFYQLSLTEPSFREGEVTDEVIIQFLKANPNRISLFSEYPENWKELLSEPNAEEVEHIELEVTISKDKSLKKKKK